MKNLTTEDTENTDVLEAFGLLQELFKTAQETLSERDYQVLNLRYGFDGKKSKTLNAIGKKFKLSRERVRQIEKSSIRKTRSAFRRKLIFQTIAEAAK